MDIIEVKKKAFVLDEKELESLVDILKYCMHRIIEHPSSGINSSKRTKRFVEYLLNHIEEEVML